MKSKWFRRMLAGALSAVLCCGMLTGCGGGGKLPETDQLNIFNLVDSSTIRLSGFYEIMVALYLKQYPDVAFDYRVSDLDCVALTYGDGITPEMGDKLQQYYDSVSVSIMKSQCEDVIYADTFYQWFDDVTPPDYNKMIKAGAFMDLKPVLAEISPELDLSIYDSLLVDGKLYAVPVYRQPYYLFSAENMLKKWDFDFNAQDDILTFLRKCAAWQEKHASDEDAPVVFTKQAWEYIYYNIFNIIGADVVNYQAGTANFDDPQVLEVIELLKILKSDYEEPLGDSLEGNNLTKIYDHVLFGRLGGSYESDVMVVKGYNYLNDPSVLVPLLQLDGKAATACDTYLMIPENAENKRNAARYIALVLESVASIQKGEGKIAMNVSNRNNLFAWDVGEEAFESSLTNSRQLLFTGEGVQDTVQHMYQNQGDICMPSYWYHSLKYLFDDYMAGKISIDTLASDVQSRLEIYVTE